MDRFISLLSVGISLGCVYALVALGFVVIYKATGVINFAQGDMVTLGAYIAFWAVVQQGLPTVAGYVVAVVAMFFAGVALERVTTAPLRGRSIHVIVIATLGAGLAIRAGIGLWQGSRPQNLPTPLGLRTLDIGGAAIPLQNALIVVVTAVVVTGLMVAFSRTQFGRQVRALAADGEAARSGRASSCRGCR
ncbi:MAG: branched-chain amino acid ABC transporter permease [Xanthomonadales bacterium]|nr:branched-chain amino acid ABC transporter permease [Xanthomonadales bacterium]